MFSIFRAPPRLLSSLARRLSTVAMGLEEQLAAASELVTLVQIPGAGRGLVAAKDIPQGTTMFSEFPMILATNPHAVDQACYHCLKPLAPPTEEQAPPRDDHHMPEGDGRAATGKGGSSVRFCSVDCKTSANREYWQVERHCDFRPLLEACRESNEKLPLMLARLACAVITAWQSGGSDTASGGRIGRGGSGKVPRGNAMEDLGALCFANIGSPPPPWRETHALLLKGLQSHPSNSNLGSAALWKPLVPEMFSLEWFCWVMSRLHINVFRVDTVPELSTLDPAAMLRAAAALVSSSAAPGHATGAGAYLLASMLNHSCEPNLEVLFPHNNAVVTFVAARDISAGEQLCISYVDQELAHEPRRQALSFSYGFDCRCPKCREGR